MQEQATFISCVSWILKGYAASAPREYQLTEQEIAQIKADPEVREELIQQQRTAMEEDNPDDDLPIFGENMNERMHDQSPYPMAIEELSQDQMEDFLIKETDALIIAGKVEKDHSSLEIYIYEQDKNNLFVHHELMLSSFPLAIEWLRLSLGSISSGQPQKGNMAIVASFLPEIQIWNLDIMEAVQPDLVLGGQSNSKSKKPKKFSNSLATKKFKPGSHTDSVLSLSLNKANLGILASGSADNTIKIWDIAQQVNIHTATHHSSKVSKVEWSSTDISIMFAASEDRSISILDSRYPDDKIIHNLSQKESIESACWNASNSSQILYVTDKGNMHILDARKPDQVCASQQVHSSSVNDVKVSSKNLAFTCSEDQYVRVWDLMDLSKPLAAKNPKCGKLFCMDLMELQEGPVLSVGNQKGELFIWDVTENQKVDEHWKK